MKNSTTEKKKNPTFSGELNLFILELGHILNNPKAKVTFDCFERQVRFFTYYDLAVNVRKMPEDMAISVPVSTYEDSGALKKGTKKENLLLEFYNRNSGYKIGESGFFYNSDEVPGVNFGNLWKTVQIKAADYICKE